MALTTKVFASLPCTTFAVVANLFDAWLQRKRDHKSIRNRNVRSQYFLALSHKNGSDAKTLVVNAILSRIESAPFWGNLLTFSTTDFRGNRTFFHVMQMLMLCWIAICWGRFLLKLTPYFSWAFGRMWRFFMTTESCPEPKQKPTKHTSSFCENHA